ncbi:MAG: hypothetical protein AB8B99_17060 [Phormidesmis sp.]
MSPFIAQPKEEFVKICMSGQQNSDPVVLLPRHIHPAEYDLALDCSIQMIKADSGASLLSRVVYPFPRSLFLRGKDALHYAEVINCLLVHSRVFVNQDIDGDRRYSLQMDTLLPAPCDRSSIAQFLDHIAQDAGVLIQYFQSKAIELQQDEASEKPQGNQAIDHDALGNTVIPFKTHRRVVERSTTQEHTTQ